MSIKLIHTHTRNISNYLCTSYIHSILHFGSSNILNSNIIGDDKQWILHDWNDEECVKILKKCKEAITSDGKKGKVIIIDMMRENKKRDSESIETQLFFDMLMMVLVTGTERDEKEWAKLFADAGFSDYKITPILGLRSLIEVYP